MHEMTHYLVGLVFGLHPTKISLYPHKKEDGSWSLGSVSMVTEKRPMRAMLAGLAPLLILFPGCWLLVQSTIGDISLLSHAWRIWVASLLIKNSLPSKADFEIALPGLVITGTICLLLSSALQIR